MENTNLAQWVIDNRYAKSEKEKVSDAEMYHKILEHTAQLQADKAELLEALENSNLQIKYLHEKFKETGSGNAILSKNKSLIQKHKQ